MNIAKEKIERRNERLRYKKFSSVPPSQSRSSWEINFKNNAVVNQNGNNEDLAVNPDVNTENIKDDNGTEN